MKRWTIAIAALAAAAATVAQAHVRVRPAESKSGAEETYTMVVPTEGKVATTAVELEAPPGVVIVSAQGAAPQVKQIGDHTSISWQVEIPPGERREFVFVARNPKAAGQIAWKAHQHFADGTVSHWADGPGSRLPASVTTLSAP